MHEIFNYNVILHENKLQFMKAQKKPVIINFFPVKDISTDLTAIQKWVHGFGDKYEDIFQINNETGLTIKTLEGSSYSVTNDDVIIRGVKGEYYPCKKDIFDATYDVLGE